jgi:hypothetical protein
MRAAVYECLGSDLLPLVPARSRSLARNYAGTVDSAQAGISDSEIVAGSIRLGRTSFHPTPPKSKSLSFTFPSSVISLND